MADGTKAQAAFLRKLRADRGAAFRGEIVPYFRYVFQSGFGLFVSAIFFAALLWYVDLVKDVPADWPAKTVGVAALGLASVLAPLRTYLQPADTIFLLPMETRLLRDYLDPAINRSIVSGVLRSLCAFALYAPIYTRSPKLEGIAPEHPLGLAAIGLTVAIVAGLNAYGAWRERQLVSPAWRLSLRALRWALTAVAFAVLLLKPLYWSVPFVIASASIVALLWRMQPKHALPWERLIAEEEGVRRRWMSFLSWFVDVRTDAAKAYRRAWISWIGERIAWRQSRAWHYLYALTFVRGDTFGALYRWVIVAAVVLAATSNGIADAVAYAIALLIAGLQLSELKRVRFVETADALPIAAEGRLPAAADVARVAGLAAALVLAVLAAATSGGAFSPSYELAALAAGLLWTGWWVPRRIAKRSGEDED